MKVILLKDVRKVGKEGETIQVKDGYARNYLIPAGFALPATESNVLRQEKIKREHLKSQKKKYEDAQKLKEKIESISLTLTSQVKENDEIYGSINEVVIIKALQGEGINLSNKKIQLDNPIRKLGVYNLIVKLSPDIEANLRIWIVKK